MFTFIFQLIDKALFTVVFIVGIQLPAFINAYSQRLSGHLNEAKAHLQQYQSIADIQFQGSIEQLIRAFKSNSDTAIQQMSQVITDNKINVENYQQQIINLENNDYLNRLYYFVVQFDGEKASNTLASFIPAIPLELNALITGVVFSLLVSLVITLSSFTSKRLFSKYKQRSKQNTGIKKA